jgi:protein TonB
VARGLKSAWQIPAAVALGLVTATSLVLLAKVSSQATLPKFGEFVKVDEFPVPISSVTPERPSDGVFGVEGTVMVWALVDRNGRVKETRVTHPYSKLEKAAQAAARHWVFRPARANGRPIAVWVRIPLRFTPQ